MGDLITLSFGLDDPEHTTMPVLMERLESRFRAD